MSEQEQAIIYQLIGLRKGLGVIDNAVLGVDKILASSEIPRAAVGGSFSNGNFGVLLGTDSRLVRFDKDPATRKVTVQDIPYGMIKSINYKMGFLSSSIEIQVFINEGVTIGGLRKKAVVPFVEWVQKHIRNNTSNGVTARGDYTTVASFGAISSESESLSEQIAKLACLRDSGVLTEAEFVDAKRKLLKE